MTTHSGRQNLVSYGLLALALFAVGTAADRPLGWLLILPLMAANMLHPFLADRIRINLGFRGTLLLSLPFALLYRELDIRVQGIGLVDFNLAFYAALYLGALSLTRLYGPEERRRLPILITTTALMLTAMGGEIPRVAYGVMIALYFLALVAALRLHIGSRFTEKRHRRSQRIGLALAVLSTLFLTVALAWGSHHYYYKVGRLFMRYVIRKPLPGAGGFSNSAELGSISARRDGQDAEAIALRAFGSQAPGYLRGALFIHYAGGRWTHLNGHQDLRAKEEDNDQEEMANGDPRGRPRLQLPERPKSPRPLSPTWEIFPRRDLGAHFFLPLNCNAVATTSRSVKCRPGNILTSQYHSTHSGYGVYDQPDPVHIDADRSGLTGLPENEWLLQSLKRICDLQNLNRDLPIAQKVERLRAFFQNHYRYSLEATFHPGNDPMIQFLDGSVREGHCEYFASAGTLLLRHLRVPARYVTGFLCEEKNRYADLYLARNKHAHAWVEYYDAQRGWQTAEFTPPDGMPGSQEVSATEALQEYLSSMLTRLSGLGVGGVLNLFFQQLARLGQWLTGDWLRLTLFLLVIGGGTLIRHLRRRRIPQTRRRRVLPDDLARLRAEVLALEKRLARRDLGRRPEETLSEYADRLTAAEPWPGQTEAVTLIRTYAEQRYKPWPAG